MFKQNEAFSFQIATDDQAETDRHWNAFIGNGGAESESGWCKDKWGLSWQITPRVLTESMAKGGDARCAECDLDPSTIDNCRVKHDGVCNVQNR